MKLEVKTSKALKERITIPIDETMRIRIQKVRASKFDLNKMIRDYINQVLDSAESSYQKNP